MSESGDFNVHLVAAKNGNAASMFYVAECHADGVRAPKDLRLAAQWFEKAAKHGVVDAMYELARCYIAGTGVPQDYRRASFWLQKAYSTDHLTTGSLKPGSRRREEVARLMMRIEMQRKK